MIGRGDRVPGTGASGGQQFFGIPQAKNPIFEIVSGGDSVTLILLYFLATVWGRPVVEERCFGATAFFRHMRGIVGLACCGRW